MGSCYHNFELPKEKYHPIKQQERVNLVTKQGTPVVVDNLVQILTGEGKSITLACVSIIFALYGYDISCACYSDYLSQRDYMDFKDLFKIL